MSRCLIRYVSQSVVIVVIATCLTAQLQAQVSTLWEKWVTSVAPQSMDITSDGRYLVMYQRTDPSVDMLLVRDNASNTMRGYYIGPQGPWRRLRLLNDTLVRVADRDNMQEFNLNTRMWVRNVPNNVLESSTCKDKGGFVNISNDVSHLIFVNHLCKPVRARVLRYDNTFVVRDWTVPEPFNRVTYGRTQSEFIYYNGDSISVEINNVVSDKRLTFPNLYVISDVMTLHGYAYVTYKSKDNVHHLCKIDIDNLNVVAQVDIVSSDNTLRIVEGPTPDRLHLYGGSHSVQYNAVTLQSYGKTAVKTAHRILMKGKEFIVAESGRNIYRTTDPSVKGDVFNYLSKPLLGIAQTVRGKLLRFDDTLTSINPRTGTSEYDGTDMSRGFLEIWSYFIADHTSDHIAIGASDRVVFLEGDRYTTTSSTIQFGSVAISDTTWHFNGAINFPEDGQRTSFWQSFRPGTFPYTFGGAVWTCATEPNGNCTSFESPSGIRYSRAQQTSPAKQAINFTTFAGPTAMFVSDTTLLYENVLRTGTNQYALSTSDGYALLDSLGNTVSAIAAGSKLVPRSVCVQRDLMLCWRNADKRIVLVVISTGKEVWSMPFPSSPSRTLIDRQGQWMIISHTNGQTIAFDISGVTSVRDEVQHRIRLYPNPASEYTNTGLPDNAIWTIVDALGREWLRGSSQRIPLADLPSGMYCVRSVVSGRVQVGMMCVQR
ncbi:MAG: T9SS type A sorting domain-containing protein [bacterium]|nr:T9SS type A sorting domain-containing protein [bacterium]